MQGLHNIKYHKTSSKHNYYYIGFVNRVKLTAMQNLSNVYRVLLVFTSVTIFQQLKQLMNTHPPENTERMNILQPLSVPVKAITVDCLAVIAVKFLLFVLIATCVCILY